MRAINQRTKKTLLVCDGCLHETRDGYMLSNDLWDSLGMKSHSHLCFDCLQKRAKEKGHNKFTRQDFVMFPINFEILGMINRSPEGYITELPKATRQVILDEYETVH